MEPKTARRASKVHALPEPHVSASGLCADTIVLTLAGEQRVCDLAIGAKVITRDSGTAILRDIRCNTQHCAMVQIKAGSLGHRRPPQDLLLPAQTALNIRDWRAKAIYGVDQALIPAEKLQDGEYVRVLPKRDVEVYELIFERPHIIYAGGMEMACQTPS